MLVIARMGTLVPERHEREGGDEDDDDDGSTEQEQLKSYVDYCWFSLKRQRFRQETTMLCLFIDLRSSLQRLESVTGRISRLGRIVHL